MKKIILFLTLILFNATLVFGNISGSEITANTTGYNPGNVNLSFHLDHVYALNEGLVEISMDFPADVIVNSAEDIYGNIFGTLLYDGQTGEDVEVTWTLSTAAYYGDDDFTVNVTSNLSQGDDMVISWEITGDGFGDPPHTTSGTINITTMEVPELINPQQFSLSQNYPNPFTKSTLISYTIPKPSNVKIQIYNIRGYLVEELINGIETAGRKQIEWNVPEIPASAGTGLSSGIYFYRLSTEEKSFIKTMILMR